MAVLLQPPMMMPGVMQPQQWQQPGVGFLGPQQLFAPGMMQGGVAQPGQQLAQMGGFSQQPVSVHLENSTSVMGVECVLQLSAGWSADS